MHSVVDASQIVETCDTVGVSRRGYRALSRVWFKNLKQHRIQAFGLPRANHVVKVRNLQNLENSTHIWGLFSYRGLYAL